MQLQQRPTFRSMLGGVLNDVVHLNFASVRTVLGLFTRGGRVAREHLEDLSANLVRPFSYSFWASTAWILVDKFLTRKSEIGQFFDPFASVSWLWPYLGIALLVPIAGLQRLLFRKREFSAAESFTFLCYTFGQIIIYEIALLLVAHDQLGAFWLRIPELLYTSWAVTGFYQKKGITTWLRGALIYLAGAALMMGTMYLYQWWRFKGLF